MAVVFVNGINASNKSGESLTDEVEALTSCESVGWKNNDGNCVKNSHYDYFCKEDDWLSITDCLMVKSNK